MALTTELAAAAVAPTAGAAGPRSITVTPATGVTDGDAVTVSGTGFTLTPTLSVTLCEARILDAAGNLVSAVVTAACGAESGITASAAGGMFTTAMTALRSQRSVGGADTVTCGDQPDDCVVFAVQVNPRGQGTWGTTSISFDSTVRCGQTITHDTQLTGDLLSCPGNGLIIGADDITLDLNGHTISGAPHDPIECFSGGPPPGPCVGVFPNGHRGLTIMNGSIANFDTGIGGVGASASTRDLIALLTLTANTNNDIHVGADSVVAFNRVTRPAVVGARGVIAYNTATERGSFVAFDGDHVRIERNVAHTDDVGVLNIELNAATDSTVANNWLIGGGLFVHGGSHASTVTTNVLVKSHIFVGGSASVVVSKNVVLGTPRGLSLDGILVGFDPARGGAADADVSDNLVVGAARDGIAIESGRPHHPAAQHRRRKRCRRHRESRRHRHPR